MFSVGKHFQLPKNLPIPIDDGACNHLPNTKIPDQLILPSTDGKNIDLSKLNGITVIYCYPRTGEPNKPVPEQWDATPGARGCTPQSCNFRDNWNELKLLKVDHLFGCSTQNTIFQKEVVQRLHLPFPLLSDENFQLIDTFKLPTFTFENYGKLLKRLTLIIKDGIILKVFYPIFPPDENVLEVIEWLKQHQY